MKRWIRRMARGAALAAAAGLLLAGPGAWAGSVDGKGLVIGKDLAARTIALNGGRTLHVTESTAFEDADGARSSLAALPVAGQEAPGMYQVSPDATIRFEATTSGDRLVAHRVKVTGVPLE